MKKTAKITAIAIALIIVVCFVAIFATCPDLSEEKLINISQTLTILDKDNNTFATFNSGQDRQCIDFDKIPESVINALLSTEDIRFYSHNGIDIKRIVGAAINDITSGSLKEGASTITQQLVKNSHLTNKKSFLRKAQEAILSVQLEKKYSKDKILEMYLNYVYFGRGAYGIQMAAQKYFGKNATDLTVNESATLVGLLKAPNIYAPHINLEKSVSRRNIVLDQMNKYGFLSDEETESTKKEDITVIELPEKSDYGYFTDYVLEEGANLMGISVSDFMGSGYYVYTYLDIDLQNSLQKIFENDENFPKDNVQGAAVVLDNKTGGIRAMIGGREHEGLRVYNRATAKRQPGSTIKPIIVYGAALENNLITASSVYDDTRKDFDGYSPTNFRDIYYGKTTVRNALALSLNVPAVEILLQNGIEYSKSFAENLGIEFDDDDNYPALALGGMKYGASVLNIAGAYRTFATYGCYSKPQSIDKIVDNDGNVVYSRDKTEKRVMKESTAYIITDILFDVSNQRGNALKNCDFQVACKTGTVGYGDLGYSDAWCASYCKNYTVCVWMGCDRTDNENYIDSSVTGSTYPAKITKNIYDSLSDYGSFSTPKSVEYKEIDGYSLNKTGITYLATEYTLSKYRLTEVYSEDNSPNIQSRYWSKTEAPTNITAQLNEVRQAEISFSVLNEYTEYILIKNNVEEIGRIKGNDGDKKTFIDENYSNGDFYIIYTENTNIIVDGQQLKGEKSSKIYLH